MHTRWIETEFDNDIAPYGGTAGASVDEPEPSARRVVVEVGGKRLEVVAARRLGLGGGAGAAAAASGAEAPAPRRPAAPASGDSVTAPMQGTIVKVAVEEGDQVVAEGDLVVVLEAMKMEQPLTAHKAGTITGLTAEVGATVTSGTVLLRDQGLTPRRWRPSRPARGGEGGAGDAGRSLA